MRLDDSNIRFNSFEDSIFNPSSNAFSIETNSLLVKMVARQKLTCTFPFYQISRRYRDYKLKYSFVPFIKIVYHGGRFVKHRNNSMSHSSHAIFS